MRRSKHSDDSRLFFDWLEIAARDLLAARLLMERQQCLEIAGFHCQQAVEKGLKAYIIHASGQLVDGHNVTWLCRQAVRYNSVLGARYVVLTNGLVHYCYEYAEGRYTRMDRFPRL